MGLFDIFTKKAKERERERIEEEKQRNELVWNLIKEKGWETGAQFIKENYKDEAVRENIVKYVKSQLKAERDAWLAKREADRIQKEKEDREKREAEKKERARLELEYKEKELAFSDKYNEIISSLEFVPVVVSDKPAKKLPMYLLDSVVYSTIAKRSRKEVVGNFVVIDVETTGFAASKEEIVEVAAIRFQNFAPVSCFTSLLFPKKGIKEDAEKINGITSEMVEGKPTFAQIANSFLEFIGEDTLVGHNLEFDLGFIVKNGADVTTKTRKYHDTCLIAKKLIKKKSTVWDNDLEEYVPDFWDDGIDNYKLSTLCRWYGIACPVKHRALADALATGILFEKLYDEKMAQAQQKYSSVKVSTIDQPGKENIDPAHPLYEKKIVFTGTLSLDRHDAMQKAVNVGAVVRSDVSSKTDYLVVGVQDNELVGSDGLSGKQEKAYALNSSGKGNIQIIDEKKFIELLSWGNANDLPQV